MTINSVTVNSASAGDSGGVIYVTGNNAKLTSNTLNINTASANSGDGGVFHFENTGTSTLVLDYLTV